MSRIPPPELLAGMPGAMSWAHWRRLVELEHGRQALLVRIARLERQGDRLASATIALLGAGGALALLGRAEAGLVIGLAAGCSLWTLALSYRIGQLARTTQDVLDALRQLAGELPEHGEQTG